MKQYFKNLESGLSAAIQNGQSSPRKLYALEIARLGARLYSGVDMVSWCGIYAPFEILNAMGVTSCFVEFIGAMVASTGTVGPMIEETDHIGYSSDACSYHRAVTGAAIKGLMPVPAFLVGSTSPCTGGVAVIENLAAHFKKPLYLLQIPQDFTENNIRYLASQFRDMAAFIKKSTGVVLDNAALTTSVKNSNRARELLLEIYRLAASRPSPVSSKDLANFGIVLSLLFGTEEAVRLAESYRDEFSRRVQAGKSGVPKEKIRLLWIQNRIQFKHPIETMLADEYGAAIVCDELNDVTWDPIDPDDPYEGIARRCLSIPFNGTIENRVKHLQKLAKDYAIDGAINPCNWGCRQGTGARGLIEEGLKKVGVPVLNLEVDCVDSRKFTEGQFRTRIEAFMEMLDQRPSPWSQG